jgi:gas vesicle protein
MDFILRGTKQNADGAVAKILLGTGIGVAIGLFAGLLLAPRAGSETRQLVAENAKATAEKLKSTILAATDDKSGKHNPHTDDPAVK